MTRTHGCGDLRADHIGEKVVLCGWVNRTRDHGSVIFIDLRDRSGVVQTVFDPERSPANTHQIARSVGNEYVLKIEGEVVTRFEGTENPSLPTGMIEIRGEAIEILNPAKPQPFSITSENDPDEFLRLKHRYLDLRRDKMRDRLAVRHRFVKAVRDFMDNEGFWEIETPILWKHTPEGAREYLVPSRLHPGKFYVLPQSPQICKQLLMVSGVERYFQIAKCFRDEDPRADRQPEHSQIDIEMSFVDPDDVLKLVEQLLASTYEQAASIKIQTPFPRMTYADAMARFGTDKPDTRFGMELVDLTDIVAESGFRVFAETISNGGQVKGLCASGCANFSRKEINNLTELSQRFGAKGLATFALGDSDIRSQVKKFLSDDELNAMFERSGAQAGDLLLIVADQPEVVAASLNHLRLELGNRLDLVNRDLFNFLWVTDFPLLHFDAGANRYTPEHHPFTSPHPDDLDFLREGIDELTNSNAQIPKGHADHILSRVRANAYDLVLNGYEVGGGSIRIHQREVQELLFQTIDLPFEEAQEKFGFLLEAFEYGAPPHGGIALGLDRHLAVISGCEGIGDLGPYLNIRDVMAFPKTTTALDPLTSAPTTVANDILREQHVEVIAKDESASTLENT